MPTDDQLIITEQIINTLAEGKDQITAVSPWGPVFEPGDLRSALIDPHDSRVTGFLIHSEDGPVYKLTIVDTQA